jgi:hypothetical protein
MSDPIETRLYEYFGRLRPNPGFAAEARLVAALDLASARPTRLHVMDGSVASVLPGGARRLALLATAAVAIVAVVGTFGVWTLHSGPVGVSPSPSRSDSTSPFDTPSASPTAIPTPTSTPTPTQPPGPISVAPSQGWMTQARDMAATALLLDGRVLIIGGSGGDPYMNVDLASAELFDPKTKRFTATGPMYQTQGRYATATTLLDGRVLVVGGTDMSGMTPSTDAELYDPSTGRFSETGRTVVSPWYHTATRLRDGRVLVISGEGLDLGANSATQIYDPATGKFTQGPDMTTVVYPDVALLLTDGRILVVGNRGEPGGDVAELYDPASNAFSPTGALVSPPDSVAGTVLADGRVCIAGGGLIQIYDPANGRFAKVGSLSFATRPQAVIALKNGRVLVTYLNDNNRTHSAQVFNPATGKSVVTGQMPVKGLLMYTTTLLLDGRVLIAGSGYSDEPNVGALFDPSTNTFVGTDK